MTDIAVTEHPFSQAVCQAIHEGTGWNLKRPEDCGPDIACYGILRGCGEAMKRAEHFWYVDHGYFHRGHYQSADGEWNFDGYYRVVEDSLWHDAKATEFDDWTRFESFGIELQPWRTSGHHVVVVPPSVYMAEYLGLQNWLGETLRGLRRHTDRTVIVHEKGSQTPLSDILDGAWCMVTHHSNAAIDALTEGIPAIMTGRGLGSIEDVENPPMRRDFFARLANSQWTLNEMKEGLPWR